VASVRSLDNALEVDTAGTKITSDIGITQIPDNGRIIRNLIHAADTVMSHITHFYALSALDFVDASALGAPLAPTYTGSQSLTKMVPGTTIFPNLNMVQTNYVESLTMRRKCHTMSAIFAGRHPIQNAIVPGGVTTMPTETDVKKFSFLLDQVRNFINTAYIMDVVTVAKAYSTYWLVGTQPGHLLSYGEYPIQTGNTAESLLIERGVVKYVTPAGTYSPVYDGANCPTAFLGNVREHVNYSYYSSPSQLHPSVGKTEPDVTKVNNKTQYSWLKAPRFGTENLVCEVGPLSRLIATYAYGSSGAVTASGASGVTSGFTVTTPSAISALSGTYSLGTLITAAAPLAGGAVSALVSVLGRHACRALECKFLADAMADTGGAKSATHNAWLTELRAGTGGDSAGTVFTNLTNPVYVYAKLPTKPKMGAGWAEAPRGALGHWITIEKKKIANYQCVVPSTWNHSPRDDSGNLGAAEQVVRYGLGNLGALAGYTLDDAMISFIRVLHTYDFCIACAVHVVKPDGSTVAKFKMDTDGKVTKLPVDAEI